MLGGLRQNLVHMRRPHRDRARPAFECLRVSCSKVWVSSGLTQGQGLWVQQTWVWHKLSWRRLPFTPPLSPQNLHRTGETDSWRPQTKPYAHQDTGERSSGPTRDWPRFVCDFPRVSSRGEGRWWPAAGLRALSVALHAQDLLKDFILGGSKMTAVGDCNHEIKRRLLLGRKAMTNLDTY